MFNNLTMKSVVLVLFVFFGSELLFAQSKKELIVSLTNRVDSLNQIVSSERSYKDRLNSEVSNLKKQLLNLETTEDRLLNEIKVLEDKNSDLLNEHNKFKKEVEQKLKTKQDSLFLITAELLKYKPAPKEKLVVKQDNTGPIKTVTIGTQVWMVSNLNVATFRNGVEIPEVQDEDAWEKVYYNKQPAWCYYNNNSNNGVKYGKLYNWYAVNDTNRLCPQGWHVPSDSEWTVLTDYLGGEPGAGSKMKAKSGWNKVESGGSASCPVCSAWNDEYRRKTACHRCKDTRYIPAAIAYHSGDGTNESGFTGLPGGARYVNGDYNSIGGRGYWWSSKENGTGDAWFRYLYDDSGGAYRDSTSKLAGLSVRCLRD